VAAAIDSGRASLERRRRASRLLLALALLAGTFGGVVATSVIALLLAAPRLLARGLEPVPEQSWLGRLVAPAVAEPTTHLLLWGLGLATLALAGTLVADARRVWRIYAIWATIGGALAIYAMLANWALAPEVGVLALLVGGAWSAAIGVAVRATERRSVDAMASPGARIAD
jgi:hypothetical protein